MSPAASRRFRVSFFDWEHHEVLVLADSRDAAIAKATEILRLTGMCHLESDDIHAVEWHGEPLEARS